MFSAAVIGAGPAGMQATLTLRAAGAMVTCFEVHPCAGGLWNAHDDVIGPRGINSPIYPSMRSVLPKDLMAFSDHRFPFLCSTFPHHTAVHSYLKDYANKKGINSITRFNTKVDKLSWQEDTHNWKLLSVNFHTGDVFEWMFDAVVVASGIHHQAHLPDVEGQDTFVAAGGRFEHSSDYRRPRDFAMENVVVVGDGPSSFDIAREASFVARSVKHSVPNSVNTYTVMNNALTPAVRVALWRNRTKHVQKVPPLERFDGRTAYFSDGTKQEDVDSVVCATGYRYCFPFLEKSLQKDLLGEDAASVRHLYNRCLYTKNPTLGFVGMPRDVVNPFVVYEMQAMFVAAAMSQKVALPPTPDMEAAIEADGDHGKPMGLDGTVAYYNSLVKQLGGGALYYDNMVGRKWHMVATALLSWVDLVRSWAPARRRYQHVVLSNKV